MAHSNQIREFVITDRGLDLVPVYVGVDGNIFIGAARAAKASEEDALAEAEKSMERAHREIMQKRGKVFEAEQAAARARFEAQEKEIAQAQLVEERRERKAARAAERRHRLAVANDSPRP
jgi:circadian clock protein KaiC